MKSTLKDKGADSKEYAAIKERYYKQKAIFDIANKLMADAGAAGKEAAAQVDAATYMRKLDWAEQDEIEKTIKKYLNIKTTGDATKDALAKKNGLTLLAKYEDDAAFKAL